MNASLLEQYIYILSTASWSCKKKVWFKNRSCTVSFYNKLNKPKYVFGGNIEKAFQSFLCYVLAIYR